MSKEDQFNKEEVRNLVTNVVQHISDSIYKRMSEDLKRAEEYALRALVGSDSEKKDSERHALELHAQYSKLKQVAQDIKDNRYHATFEEYKERKKVKK